ncbi:MAG: tRNA (adenosine(37)-N6)-dimethylallyltransferase MiaA, partial [Litorimonas sp.]
MAKVTNGEIVNADALQVYAQLSILSARPNDDEMQQIPHHLYGCVDGHTRYSTGAWLRDVQPVILDILARGKTPIITGGTGLYFKALTEGLADIPRISPQVSARVQKLLDEQGVSVLRGECEACDPVATARIVGDNPHRLMRVLSVFWQSGKALSDWQLQTRPIVPSRYVRCAVLMPDREGLYDKINKRYAAMVDNGGVDEARYVMGLGMSDKLPMMKAIGLPPLLQYLRKDKHMDGDLSAGDLKEALAQSQQDTRRFAKRQMTWFRNQTPDWPKLTNEAERTNFIEDMQELCAR